MTRKKIIILMIVGICLLVVATLSWIFVDSWWTETYPRWEKTHWWWWKRTHPGFFVLNAITAILIVILIVVIITKKNEKEKINKESLDAYVSKLNVFLPKEVTISATSGTITDNKNSIEAKIKTLVNFPLLPARTTWEVKDADTTLTTNGVPITLVVKKDSTTKEVSGFSVKRSELNQESLDAYISKLNALLLKEVTISATSGTITDNKNSIEAKIKTLTDFPPLPTGITWEVKDADTTLTTNGVPITLVIKKDSTTKEVSGFSVKIS